MYQVPESQLVKDWPYGNNVSISGKSTINYSPQRNQQQFTGQPTTYYGQVSTFGDSEMMRNKVLCDCNRGITGVVACRGWGCPCPGGGAPVLSGGDYLSLGWRRGVPSDRTSGLRDYRTSGLLPPPPPPPAVNRQTPVENITSPLGRNVAI